MLEFNLILETNNSQLDKISVQLKHKAPLISSRQNVNNGFVVLKINQEINEDLHPLSREP